MILPQSSILPAYSGNKAAKAKADEAFLSERQLLTLDGWDNKLAEDTFKSGIILK